MSLRPEDMKKVGGSDVAAILGLSRYAGPLVPYLRIVEGVEREDNDTLEDGRESEPGILRRYRKRTGFDMQTGISLWGLPEHLRANLDALAYVGRERSRVVEAKRVGWRAMDDWGSEGTDEVPPEYGLQVQFYQGALREDERVRRGDVHPPDDVADVPALLGGSDFGVWQVAYDADMYAAIRAGIDRFWRDHVEKRVPPEPTALSSDAEFIRKRFPRHTAKALEWSTLTTEQRHTLVEYKDRHSALAYAEREAQLAAARVKALLGEHEGVAGLPDGSRLTWRQDKPSQVTDWEEVAKEAFAVSEYRGDAQEWNHLVERHTTTREGKRPLVWRTRSAK